MDFDFTHRARLIELAMTVVRFPAFPLRRSSLARLPGMPSRRVLLYTSHG